MPRKTLRLKAVRKSHKSEKKWDAVFERNGREKVVPFGAAGMSDYTKHKDKTRRASYLQRHKGMGEHWDQADTAGALSRWILWGPSTSFRQNLKSYKRRFHL